MNIIIIIILVLLILITIESHSPFKAHILAAIFARLMLFLDLRATLFT